MALTNHIRPRKGNAGGEPHGGARPALSAPRAAMVDALVARFRRRCDRTGQGGQAVSAFLSSLSGENAPAEVIAAVAARLRSDTLDKPWDPSVTRGPTPSFAARIAAERAARSPALAR